MPRSGGSMDYGHLLAAGGAVGFFVGMGLGVVYSASIDPATVAMDPAFIWGGYGATLGTLAGVLLAAAIVRFASKRRDEKPPQRQH